MDIRRSATVAWSAMILMILVIILAIVLGMIVSIWDYITIFLAFMAVFCHLAAVLLVRMSALASKKLDIAAIIFGCLGVISLIVIFILNFIEFY